MKNVVLVHFSSKPGGIEVILRSMVSAMKNIQFDVFVIRPPRHGDLDIYSGIDNISIHYGGANYLAYFRLFFFALKHRTHIFHTFNIGPFFLFILRLANVKKLVYAIHGTKYWNTKIQKIIQKTFWHLGMSKNYLVTANSKFSKKVFISTVLNLDDRIQLLYNPVDVNRFRPATNIENNKSENLRIIYVGRLAKGKNLDLWVEIAHYLLQKNDKYTFEIYGTGPLHNYLDEKIKGLGCGDKINLKGFIPNPEEAYRSADLLLFLSEYESFGNVVVESVLCGTPVLCSDIPVMQEIFEEAPEFIVCLDNNIKKAVYSSIQKIEQLKAKTMCLAPKFSQKYSQQRHFDQLDRIYQSLL